MIVVLCFQMNSYGSNSKNNHSQVLNSKNPGRKNYKRDQLCFSFTLQLSSKKNPYHMLSWEFCKSFPSDFSADHLREAATLIPWKHVLRMVYLAQTYVVTKTINAKNVRKPWIDELKITEDRRKAKLSRNYK